MEGETGEQVPKLDNYIGVIDTTFGTLSKPSEAALTFKTHLEMHPKAILMPVAPTGAVPEAAYPWIKQCAEQGIPVFLLSTNYHRKTGIQSVEYESVAKAVEAGAIPVKDVNINSGVEVLQAIRDLTKEGLSGDELEKAIIARFNTVPEAQKEAA